MALDVQAIAQAQGPELFLGQLPGEVAARLVAELRDARIHEGLVELVVLVHGRIDYRRTAPVALNTVWLGAPLSGVMSLCNTRCLFLMDARRAGTVFRAIHRRSALRTPRAPHGHRDRQSA